MRMPGACALAVGIAAALPGCGPANDEVRAPAQAQTAAAIVFSYGGRLHVMRPDGRGRVRLTGGPVAPDDGGDLEPAWAPDGRRLAFTLARSDGKARLYVLNVGGGSARRVPVAGPRLYSPAWSPDGRRLAFVRVSVRGGDEGASAIVIADVEGGEEQVLLTEREDPPSAAFVGDLAWSPDGSRIAFTRAQFDERGVVRIAIYSVAAGGGTPQLLARDAAEPAWSPDGRQIAFSSTRDRNGRTCYEQCHYRPELYVMDADGSNAVRLTHNRGEDRTPSWSPDGRRIAFASDRNSPGPNGAEIYSIRPDGSCLTWLTNGSPASRDPAWGGSSGPSASGRCGSIRPRPRVEVRTDRARGLAGALWLGRSYRGLLLAGAFSEALIYDDCGRFRAAACPPSVQVQQVPVCSRSGSSTLRVLDQERYRHGVHAWVSRGMLLIDIDQGDLAASSARCTRGSSRESGERAGIDWPWPRCARCDRSGRRPVGNARPRCCRPRC